MHVLLILAMLLLVVSSLQFNAKESTNASHLLAMLPLEAVSLNQLLAMMETNAQLILVMLPLETASTLQSIVMTIMHVPLILAILLVASACMLAKFVTIKAFALLIAAILALETVFSLTSLLKRLQLNHQINVSLTNVMQFSELLPLLSLAQLDLHVPQLIVILQEDV